MSDLERYIFDRCRCDHDFRRYREESQDRFNVEVKGLRGSVWRKVTEDTEWKSLNEFDAAI